MTATAHKNLAEALVAFQAEAPTLTKDATNPHFRSRFVSLDAIVETVRPLLAKHGLAWSTLPCFGPNGEPALRYQLLHAPTGEALSDTMPLLLAKQDPQGQGSALTYGRRYSISAVLNLVADEDDDGQKATEGAQKARSSGNGGAPSTPRLLNPTERDRVLGAIADMDQNEALLFGAVGVSSVEELTVEHAKKIRELLDKQAA